MSSDPQLLEALALIASNLEELKNGVGAGFASLLVVIASSALGIASAIASANKK